MDKMISQNLKRIFESEGIISDDKSVDLLVELAKGSVRDSLSLLDRGLLSLEKDTELDLKAAKVRYIGFKADYQLRENNFRREYISYFKINSCISIILATLLYFFVTNEIFNLFLFLSFPLHYKSQHQLCPFY